MPRPYIPRYIAGKPPAAYFKPAGVPLSVLEEVVLTLDEFEALRLADFEGMYQEQAATQMNVSRPTFGRILDTARRKVAEALVSGRALRIEGGPVAQPPPVPPVPPVPPGPGRGGWRGGRRGRGWRGGRRGF
ncbi:MAG: hypothetical protein DRP22_02795 [Verrucomicrobia bacterium]|nr:MAG: hypothetical protein DRP22_02795 [Verrucomicrobiota bacterium]